MARNATDPNETPLAREVRHDDAMAIATTRAAQEVQAAMVVAKRFPRDTLESERRILEACKRPALAEQAMYAYPRGGATVEGPSIRLAEVLAQNWGNLDTGIVELEQSNGESVMMAYAWDLETNTRQTKIFSVPHERHTKQGVAKLTDPRDVYEMTANQGARRQRACILGVIPGDIVEQAVAACNKTLEGGQKEPLLDRVKKMLVAFETLGVTKAMLENRLGHRLDAVTETEYVGFRKIWKAIQDNMQPASAFFADIPAASPASGVAATREKIAQRFDEPPQPEPTPPIEAGTPQTATDGLPETKDEGRGTWDVAGGKARVQGAIADAGGTPGKYEPEPKVDEPVLTIDRVEELYRESLPPGEKFGNTKFSQKVSEILGRQVRWFEVKDAADLRRCAEALRRPVPT